MPTVPGDFVVDGLADQDSCAKGLLLQVGVGPALDHDVTGQQRHAGRQMHAPTGRRRLSDG